MREERHEAFVRLLQSRANRYRVEVLKIINLSDPRYVKTGEEVMYYFRPIFDSLNALEQALLHHGGRYEHGVEVEPVTNMLSQYEIGQEEPENHWRTSFHRLMTNRVNATLNTIRLISNLANSSRYDYTQAEAKAGCMWMKQVAALALSHFVTFGEFKLEEALRLEGPLDLEGVMSLKNSVRGVHVAQAHAEKHDSSQLTEEEEEELYGRR